MNPKCDALYHFVPFVQSGKQKAQYQKWTFFKKNESLKTPFLWIPLCSTTFWELKTKKGRAYLLLVHKTYLNTLGCI